MFSLWLLALLLFERMACTRNAELEISMNKRIFAALLALLMALSISACGGGSGGGSQAETGQVAVVFTDGPTDQYQRILISMTAMSLSATE